MKPTIGNTMKKLVMLLLLLSTLTINYCQVFVITPRANLTRPDEPEWTEYYDYWDGGTILYNFLNWNQVAGATKYYIYRDAQAENESGGDEAIGGEPGWDIYVKYDSTESSEWYDYNVSTMMRYNYAVAAYNSTLPDTIAMSGQSAIASIYIEQAPVILTAPTWIGVGDFYYGYYNEVTDTTLQFGFYDRSNNETGFIIMRTDTGGYELATAIDTIGAKSGANTIVVYLDTTVSAATKYWYWVVAYNGTQTAVTVGSHSNTTANDPEDETPYIYVINGDTEDGVSYGFVMKDITGNTMVESMEDTTIAGDVKLLLKVTTPGINNSRPTVQAWYNRPVESGREYTFSVDLTKISGDMRLGFIGLGAGVNATGNISVPTDGMTLSTKFTATSNTFMTPTLYFDGTYTFTGTIDNWRIDTTGAEIGLTVPVITSITPSYTSITINWNAVIGATSYLIQHSANGTTWDNAITTTNTNYNHTGLSEGTLHYYRVAATDGATTTSYSIVNSTQTYMTAHSESNAYYVSTSGTGTGNGTQQFPWTLTQLVQFANTNGFAPGDSILFRRGDVFAPNSVVYKFAVLELPTMRGQKGARIYFGDYGNKALQRPTMSDRNIGAAVYHQTLRIGAVSYVTFQNIRFEGECYLRATENLNVGMNHLTFDSCDFVASPIKNGFMYIYTGYSGHQSHFPAENLLISEGGFLIDAVGNRIQNCYFDSPYSQDLVNYGGTGDSCYIGFNTFVNGGEQGFDIGNGNYGIVEYNYFVNCRYPFKIHSQLGLADGYIIRGNLALNATEGFALENMANCRVYNNTVHGIYAATMGNRDRLPEEGYYGSFRNNHVRNNIFMGVFSVWGGWRTVTLTSSYGTRTIKYGRPVDSLWLNNTFSNNIYYAHSSANRNTVRYIFTNTTPPTDPAGNESYNNVVSNNNIGQFHAYWTSKFATAQIDNAEATEIIVPPADIFVNPTYTDVNNTGNWAVDRSKLAAYCSSHTSYTGESYDDDGYNTSSYFPNYLNLEFDALRNYYMPKRGAATTSTVTRGALESVP